MYELAERGGADKYLQDDKLAALFTWQKRLCVLEELCSGLNYLHCSRSRPAFHRDIKSGNIGLTADFTAKLLDCGLSQYIPDGADATTANFSIMSSVGIFGTPGYIW